MPKVDRMLKVGQYKKVRILKTTIDELKPCVNKYGELFIAPNNKIVFEVAGERYQFKVLQSLGDFSSLSCDEIWVGVADGDITFKRIVNNPLWVK